MRNLIILLAIVLCIPAYSQLSLEINQVNDGNLDMEDFPLVQAYIKGYDNGNSVQINLENLLIMENGYTIEPISAEQAGEWQLVKWVTKRTEFSSGEMFYSSRLYWSKDNEVTYGNMAARLIEYPVLKIFEDNQTITDISYGDMPAGAEIPYVAKFTALKKRLNDTVSYPLHIDSITTQTEFFEVKWMGSDGDPDWSEPPRELRTDSRYWLKIWFKPKENKPYRDKLVLHYEGGFRKVIPLKGNSLELPFESTLKILEPNGGEVFTPCEDVTIKWEGQSPTNPVEIYYSNDAGNNWKFIASVDNASEYQWEVPADITDRAMIRVSQDFDKQKEFTLSEDAVPLSDANYHINGNKAVTLNNTGKVLEWDLLTGDKPGIISRIILNPEYDGALYKSSGINYISENKFSVMYRIISEPSNRQYDTLAYFETGADKPYKKIAVSNDVRFNKIISDFDYNNYFAIPELGTQVFVIDAESGNTLEKLDFNYPIRDISVSRNNELAVLLMNNEIRYYDAGAGFNFIKSIKYPDLRWIEKAQISQNGLFTAISEYQVTKGLKYSSYLVDNDSDILARQFTPAASEVVGLGFNTTSNILGIGSKNQPQVVLYDMTSSDSKVEIPAHASELHKMVLSPNGKSLLTLASSSSDNIYYRTFTYPEYDRTDNTFRIVKPQLSTEIVEIEGDYLGHETEHLILNITNTGEKFIDVSDVKMETGINFRVKEWEKDTVYPGESATFTLIFKPLETGELLDSVIFHTCVYELKVGVKAEGYPRNITYVNNPYDFGEVCVGELKESGNLEMLINEDPVPLKINSLRITEGQSPFVLIFPNDSIIPPGGSYYFKSEFRPQEIRTYERKIEIFYADQQELKGEFTLKGEGIGASLDYSHNKLLFIPEIPEREIEITNSGDVEVSLLNAFTEPQGFYVVNENFPINIEPGESVTLRIQNIADTDNDINLLVDADPCIQQKGITLGKYEGTSYLTIPEVTTKPTDDVEIPVSFTNTDNGDYKGERRFEGEFSIYYKLFFPVEVKSEFGEAEIYKNEVIDDNRIIGIRVNGEFPDDGTIAVITGKPGLTDILEDDFAIIPKIDIWGSTISNTYESGKLIIDDENITRVMKTGQIIEIGSISPNPANDIFTVKFTSEKNTSGIIEIANAAGQIVMKTDKITVSKGTNEISLNVNMLPVGNYNLFIKAAGEFSNKVIIISR